MSATAWRTRWTAPAVALAGVPAATVYLAGAAVAYALKTFFSGAGADELRWVLAPTCWLAAGLGGMTFTDEAGAGFISHADRIVVGAACSGVNFLIVCFAALFFGSARRFERSGTRVAWLVSSLALAYAATIATNAIQVVVAARLFRADIYQGWLTPARAHRIMGTLLYCGSLVIVHGVVGWLLRRGQSASHQRTPALPAWLLASPFLWYLAIAIGVPLFRLRADSMDARLAEHLMTVIGVVAMLALLVMVAGTLADRIRSNVPGGTRSP